LSTRNCGRGSHCGHYRGCSSAASGDSVVKVAHQRFGCFTQMNTHTKAVFTDWIPNGKVAIALNGSRVLGGGSALAGAVKG
jgi:hypothetical protein